MSEKKQRLLLEVVNQRLGYFHQILMDNPKKQIFEIDNMKLSREFLQNTLERFNDIVKEQSTDYEALYESITLEMVANSKYWSRLRSLARDMCF